MVASLPTLKFVETQVEYSTVQGDYLELPVILKNFGSFTAENVSIRIIEPPGLLLNNLSNILKINSLSPLEQQSFAWELFVDSYGEFNLVILCESDNADGDILNIRIIVNQASDGIMSTTNSQTSLFRPFEVVIVMLTALVYYKRQKYGDFK